MDFFRLTLPERQCGQATLSFVLLVGGIIMEIAIAGSLITYFLSTTGLGERVSLRALAAASTGVHDAELKITRNKEFAAGTFNYTITLENESAVVNISRIIDSGSGSYIYTITSTGSASTRKRKLVATLVVDQITGLSQLQSFREQPL